MDEFTVNLLNQFKDLDKMQQAEFINALTTFYRGDIRSKQITHEVNGKINREFPKISDGVFTNLVVLNVA